MVLDDDLVSVKVLADLLDIEPATVRYYASQRLLPPILGGLLPLRASVQMHCRRLRDSAKRGREPVDAEMARAALSQDGEMRELLVGLLAELRADARKMIAQGEEAVDG